MKNNIRVDMPSIRHSVLNNLRKPWFLTDFMLFIRKYLTICHKKFVIETSLIN